MRIISNFFYFSLSLLFFILNFVPYSYGIGNVDWVLLKENNDGKEWIDKGSIREINDGEISLPHTLQVLLPEVYVPVLPYFIFLMMVL